MDIPKRVLITVDPCGTCWTYVLNLIPYLQKMEVNVLLAVTGGALRPAQAAQLSAIPELTWTHLPGQTAWMEGGWRDVNQAGAWLIRLANHFQPDLVHVNSYAFASLPWKVPVLVTAQTCAIAWWQAVKGPSAPKHLREYHRRVTAGLQSADLIVAATRNTLNTLYCTYGVSTPTAIIRHGRDFHEAPTAVKRPYILNTGRCWDEARNVMLLESIAANLPWPVYVAGDTRNPATGEDLRLEHTQNLGWLGASGFQEALDHAAIYAAPALYEPFSYGILEAAASGCALVLGDIPALRELWKDAAIFVEPDRPDLWQEQLQLICENPSWASMLGERAKRRAYTFSGINMAADYIEAYQRLLNPASEQPRAAEPMSALVA